MGDKACEVVVITGASAGVGRATAEAFAHTGARVVLLARDKHRLEFTAQKVRAAGGEALALAVDVADADQVEEAARQAEEAFGPPDVWVNCAMVTVFSPVHQMTPEEYRRVTEVTYLGTVHGTLAALKRMRPRNRGTIVQVGSALAYRAIPIQSAYCGAKFAIRGFTDALRTELLHEGSGIHITMVQLSAFNTPQFDWARHRLPARPQPLPPIFQPEVAARGIVWAAHHRRRELYVGFPALKTIIASKLLPGLAGRYAARKAVDGQLDKGASPPEPPTRRQDNLFATVQRQIASHGRFDDRARDHSWQLWGTTHRGAITAAVLVAVLALGGALLYWS